MRRILFPQLKYVKQFSDLRDKSPDLEKTYSKFKALSLGFPQVFGISEKSGVWVRDAAPFS